MSKYSPLFVSLCVLVLLGAGCEASDTQLIIGFLNSWAESHGVLNADGKPTASTIAYVGSGGWISTGNTTADAAIDAGMVIKSIKDADAKVAESNKLLEENPPNRDKALSALNDAVASRPKDQFVRTHKGVLLLEMNNPSDANAFLVSKSSTCDVAKNPTMSLAVRERCYKQVQTETNEMAYANQRADEHRQTPTCALVQAQASANYRLYELASGMNVSQTDLAEQRELADALERNSSSYCTP